MYSNVWQKQYEKMGFASQRKYPNEELLRFMGSNYFSLSFDERKKIKVLEIGVGSGANIWMLGREGFDAYGMDISVSGLELCKEMLKHWDTNATLKEGSMLSLPYDDNYFDVVIDVVSMQHLSFTDHKKAYNEIKRILKNNGKLFSYHLGNKSYSFHNGGGDIVDKNTIDDIKNSNAPLAHNGLTCFPNETDITQLLEEQGFKNINIENVIKTYNNREIEIQYLVITAVK